MVRGVFEYASSESELRIFDFGHWRALARYYARKLNIAETTHVIYHLNRNFTLNTNSLHIGLGSRRKRIEFSGKTGSPSLLVLAFFAFANLFSF